MKEEREREREVQREDSSPPLSSIEDEVQHCEPDNWVPEEARDR